VILSRHEHVTRGAISHLFADRLAFQLVGLTFFETRATSKVSVARLAPNSIFSVHTRRNRLAVATRLSTLMRQATSTPFLQPLHTYCRVNAPVRLNNMKMSTYVIIHQVLFSDSTCPSKYVLAIQSPENNDPVLFEMFLESQQLGSPAPRDRCIPVVSSKRLTMGRVLYPLRYDS